MDGVQEMVLLWQHWESIVHCGVVAPDAVSLAEHVKIARDLVNQGMIDQADDLDACLMQPVAKSTLTPLKHSHYFVPECLQEA